MGLRQSLSRNRATQTNPYASPSPLPASGTCLTYAYALYDLGSALRLDGYPAAAVPILQRRLQIDNQRATVQAQLELALAQTS